MNVNMWFVARTRVCAIVHVKVRFVSRMNDKEQTHIHHRAEERKDRTKNIYLAWVGS